MNSSPSVSDWCDAGWLQQWFCIMDEYGFSEDEYGFSGYGKFCMVVSIWGIVFVLSWLTLLIAEDLRKSSEELYRTWSEIFDITQTLSASISIERHFFVFDANGEKVMFLVCNPDKEIMLAKIWPRPPPLPVT